MAPSFVSEHLPHSPNSARKTPPLLLPSYPPPMHLLHRLRYRPSVPNSFVAKHDGLKKYLAAVKVAPALLPSTDVAPAHPSSGCHVRL
eukprot:3940445-Rhodomonas_salina.2